MAGSVGLGRHARSWRVSILGRSCLPTLENDGGTCVLPDGDLENLSHYIQAYYKVPTYYTPILIGHSAGAATLAFTSLAQAPRGIFRRRAHVVVLRRPGPAQAAVRGAGTEVFENQELATACCRQHSCRRRGLALHGVKDQVCSIDEARSFISQTKDAKLIELPKVGHSYLRHGHSRLAAAVQGGLRVDCGPASPLRACPRRRPAWLTCRLWRWNPLPGTAVQWQLRTPSPCQAVGRWRLGRYR